jgi:hypothetical protein
MCNYHGLQLVDGETIRVDKCTTCHCKNGLSFCQEETCEDISLCRWMEFPKGQCCAVCSGMSFVLLVNILKVFASVPASWQAPFLFSEYFS